MQTLKMSFSFHNVFVVDCIGLSGGLALFWKYSVNLNIVSYSKVHIDTVIECQDKSFKFTGLYGEP